MNEALNNFLGKQLDKAIKYKKIVEDMLGSYERYHYAEKTLVGILESIIDTRNITDGQIKAIENIRNNPAKYHERTPRRY